MPFRGRFLQNAYLSVARFARDGKGWEVGAQRTLVVVYYVSEMVSAAVVCLAHAHRVVRQVDIAIVACQDGFGVSFST